jgi:multisubunit Na+/H+ antiporter MnhC subunit
MREPDEADDSGSTAQFRAFVDRQGGQETAQPWTMAAPGNQVLKLTLIVVGVAVVLGILAFVFIG